MSTATEVDTLTVEVHALSLRRDETAAEVERLKAREVEVASLLEKAAAVNEADKIRSLSIELESLPGRIRTAEIVATGAARGYVAKSDVLSAISRERTIARLFELREPMIADLAAADVALAEALGSLSGVVTRREAATNALLENEGQLSQYGRATGIRLPTLREWLVKYIAGIRAANRPADVVVVEVPIVRFSA